MNIEDKAKAYADKKYGDATKVWHFGDEVHEMLMDAYEAGAAEALRSQWKDASKKLPEEGTFCIVGYMPYGDNEFYCGLSHYAGDLGWQDLDDNDRFKTVFWLPLPPIPDTEEQ